MEFRRSEKVQIWRIWKTVLIIISCFFDKAELDFFLVRNGDVLKLQGLIFLIVLRAAKMHQIQGNIF